MLAMLLSFPEGENTLDIWWGETSVTITRSDKLQLMYLLREHGWADLILSQDDQCCVIPVSYLRDSLQELLVTTCALMEGSNRETVHFYSEPALFLLVLEMGEDGHLSVSCKHYDNERTTADNFQICFTGRCKPTRYVQQILASCAKILQEEGEDGYLRKWKLHHFPMKEYLRLKNL